MCMYLQKKKRSPEANVTLIRTSHYNQEPEVTFIREDTNDTFIRTSCFNQPFQLKFAALKTANNNFVATERDHVINWIICLTKLFVSIVPAMIKKLETLYFRYTDNRHFISLLKNKYCISFALQCNILLWYFMYNC